MIGDQIRNVRDSVRKRVYRDYDEFASATMDDPFKKMYYDLNYMCILISDMLKEDGHD